ncbi:hypothetical protein OS493_033727 [Desmophyllum pertusum]|uniref:Uncharacterized protein n=1 Tax=Desmophyllum pertusum TaxID=174260 RepID=A0A9W9ZKL5_9CNID|nr:hypothetical protein OS493_033727 [Desmophyllum pertusum]
MADELAESCPCRLEDLCVKFVGTNGSLWNPEQFLGIPRHLLFPILKKFHPFDVERLEVSGVFQTIGIDTDPVWRGFYLDSWPRKNKWPDVYFKTKGISKGGEGWRVCYLQRRLQDALNSRHALSKETSCSSSEVTQSLQNIVSVCGRYATYLRLYNSACVLLAENLDIFLRLAEHIEFLEVFLLRDNGVSPLCHLLQVLTTKRLKSVGFCFCKVSDVQMWSRIIHSLSKRSQEKYGVIGINAEAENVIACTPAQTTTGTCTCDLLTQGGNAKSYDFGKQTCNQLNHEQDRESISRESSVAQADENVTCDSLKEIDDFDIYDFTDSSSLSADTQENITTLSGTCKCTTHVRRSDTKEISGNVIQSLDLYDEVFGHCKSGQSTDATKELSPCPIMQVPEEASEQCRFSPGASKLETSFLTLSCSLVHFELVGFWLLPDVLALFVYTLKGWLTLESLILDDNALSFVSIMPGCEFIDTLSFLCANGRLQFLQMTNNPVNDEFAKLFFEKLVSAFCLKCNDCNNTRSLTKLKFSSNHVSPVFSEYLGRVIRDVCACKLSNQSTAEMSESIPSVTDCKDCTQAGCGKQKCSRVLGHCVTCESDKNLPLGSWKTKLCNQGESFF